MKYGVIGTGWIAESFIRGARLKCNADFTCVYSRTAQKGNEFALKNGIPEVYTDLNEFASADFDAVYIASPNLFHASQSKLMLEAGKHVICEKPVTVTPEELIENQAIASKNGLIYMEAIMYMHTPNRDKLRNAIGNIGNITSAHFDFSQLSSKYPAYLNGETPNIFNPSLATGCLMDLGIYCVYPAIDLFGLPDKITADSIFLKTGADSSGNSILNYGDKLISLTYSKTGQDYSGSSVYGDKGTITIESISKLINGKLITHGGDEETVCPYMEKDEIMGFEAVDFEKFINGINLNKYELCSKLSLLVSKIMQDIRNESGIRFGNGV
jgi:predicted dehydrogenase